MRDLADFINDALAERSGSLADLPTTTVGEHVRRKVRFRRARRHTLEAAGVTVIAAVLLTATWLGASQRHDPAPAVSPTTSRSSPTPDAIRGMPPTHTMPAGLLDTTARGWVVSIYRSDGNSDTAPVTRTVVVGSPDGTLYRGAVLKVDATTDVVLERWDAGSTTAVVHTSSSQDATADIARGILDLTSGMVFDALRGLPTDAQYVGQDASGAELWIRLTDVGGSLRADLFAIREGGAPAALVATFDDAVGPILVNPTGTRAVLSVAHDGSRPSLGVVDLTTYAVVSRDHGIDGQECQVIGWTHADTVLVLCSAPGQTDEALWSVDLATEPWATSHVRDLAASDARPGTWSGAWVSDGVLAAPSYPSRHDNCTNAVSTWASGRPTVVADVNGGATVVDRVIYATQTPSCQDQVPATVEAVPVDGPSFVILPAPSPRGDGRVWNGMTSWVPAR